MNTFTHALVLIGLVATIPAASGQDRRAPVVQAAKNVLQGGRKPVAIKSHVLNEAEMRIAASLDEQTSQSFIETPLSDAVQVLSKMHNIPIVVDTRALEELGLDHRTGVTLSLKNVKLRSFLRLMLRDLDLTYMIKDEVMQITTREAAEDNLVIEMYELPDHLAAKSDSVAKMIVQMVVPDTWESLGGNSSIATLDHLVIISTTSDVHHRVNDFLSKLAAKYKQ